MASSPYHLPPTLSQANQNPSQTQPIPRIPSKPPLQVTLLKLCQNSQEVRQVHAQCIIIGLSNRPTSVKLIESYVSTQDIDSARTLFTLLRQKDAFVYNTMMRGLTMCDHPNESISLFAQMLPLQIFDNHTHTFALKACARARALSEGEQTHCLMIKRGGAREHSHSALLHMYAECDAFESALRVFKDFPGPDTVVENAMITAYMNRGRIIEAEGVFHAMSAKDVASYSAMVTGYSKNTLHSKALNMFRDAMDRGFDPNESMVVSALSSCARTGNLCQGRRIHACVENNNMSVRIATALVDMYAKCGCVRSGYEVFEEMPRKDVVAYGAMISGFANHGLAERAFEVFEAMEQNNVRPNEAIFVSMMVACAHAGKVERGLSYFDKMVKWFDIEPGIEHYGCLVDLLSRAGQLGEAEEVIGLMPGGPNSVIIGSYLSGCRAHGDVRRGQRAVKHLLWLEPGSGDRMKLVGDVVASGGGADEAMKTRWLIRERGLESTSGVSSVEVDGVVHEFVVGDSGHGSGEGIYEMVEMIKRGLLGFVGCMDEEGLCCDCLFWDDHQQ